MGRGARRTTTSRARLAGIGLCAGLSALAAAAPAGAASGATDGDGTPAYGGSQYFAPPRISSLLCQTGCGRSAAASQTRTLYVREKGLLRIRGINLDAARVVLFLGSPGRADNLGVKPQSTGPRSLDVKIPVGAGTGPIALLDPNGHSSPPSRTGLRVLRDPNAASPQGLIWPVRGQITGWFGEPRGDHVHTGIDIATAAGTPIKAAAAGTVILQGSEGGYGNFTCIRHTTGFVTCYAHQSEYLTTYGATVQQGQAIGRVGCTGNCSGPHLHFEVRKGPAAWSTPLDPLQYLPRR